MARFPFTGDPTRDWERFCSESEAWKPAGYDAEMALRLAYYLDQQVEDTKAVLRRRFPKTWETIEPVTVPLVRHFIREQAKVFLSSTKLDLSRDGEPLTTEGDEPDPAAGWWTKAKERSGLALRLKRIDAYTTLFRTAALWPKWDEARGGFVFHVVFPQTVRVVMDPAAPMDIDRAHGVAVQIASESGLRGGAGRWEFFCAREGEAQHFILEERQNGDNRTAAITERDTGGPLRGADERAMVPLVFFTAHTEELGLFTLEGSDLIQANRGINLLATDLQHIAEQQGFGVMVITVPAGGAAPGEIVRAPNRAIELRDGADADFINPNAPIADLLELADRRIKQAAVLNGIPPGSVSVEARPVASGIALIIENRPIYEARADAIEVYRGPMRRTWDVVRALWDAYGEGEPGDLSDVDLLWTPGEIQVPTDEMVRVDAALAKMKARLQSRLDTIAELRGISKEEARQAAQEIDEEDGISAAGEDLPDDDPMGLKAKRDELAGGTAPTPGSAPAAADAGIVQDTALNGAQVSSLLEIIQAGADKALPMEAVQALVEAAFPAISPALIARIIGALKRFQPAKPEPVPPAGAPPFPPKPPPPLPPPAG
jgi:hypothetical protein